MRNLSYWYTVTTATINDHNIDDYLPYPDLILVFCKTPPPIPYYHYYFSFFRVTQCCSNHIHYYLYYCNYLYLFYCHHYYWYRWSIFTIVIASWLLVLFRRCYSIVIFIFNLLLDYYFAAYYLAICYLFDLQYHLYNY